MFVNIGNVVEPRRMFMNVRLCECFVCRNGKTSIVDYQILSFFCFRFIKKRMLVFFCFLKTKITIEPVRFTSILSNLKINHFSSVFKIFHKHVFASLRNKFVNYRTCSLRFASLRFALLRFASLESQLSNNLLR
jgi:hypothetical protein